MIENSKFKDNKLDESVKLARYCMDALREVVRESFLILDADLRVVSANSIFYQTFQALPEQTENVLFYNLGNGQWNNSELKKLLGEILAYKKPVKDYEIKYNFGAIKKTFLLNAKQIDSSELIVISIRNITSRRELEKKLAVYAKGVEIKEDEHTKELIERIKELEILNKAMMGREIKIVELKKEIEELENRLKNN